MNKLYIWSKKIHRTFLYFVIILFLIMATTGLIMKYPAVATWVLIDEGLMRYIHNQLSIYFATALGVMMITGLYMYIFPILVKRRAAKMQRNATPPPAQPQ